MVRRKLFVDSNGGGMGTLEQICNLGGVFNALEMVGFTLFHSIPRDLVHHICKSLC